MKSKLIILMSLIGLAACDPSAKTVNFPTTNDFADCKFARLTNSQGSKITVARCPLSTTTTKMSDKSSTTTIVVDEKPQPETITVNGTTYQKVNHD